MKHSKAFLAAIAALSSTSAMADDFFSTEPAEQFMTVGVRLGVNTSNVTMKKKVLPEYNINSWGTGFDAGIVADLNFRDYISVQPGFFFQSRSGNYFYGQQALNDFGEPGATYILAGHLRSYRFNIPIVASIHLNITDRLRWNIDFGPYLSVNLHSNEGSDIRYSYYSPEGHLVIDYLGLATSEFGLKMGSSLRILDHYVVGVHYLAGLTHAWKDSFAGGRNKTWSFTIGYDF